MRKLDVQFWVDGREDVITYTVDGELKRPGAAVERAREAAADDGYEELNLKQVALSEPAQ